MAKNIKLVKSLIGRKKDQIARANSLGLKKVGDVSLALRLNCDRDYSIRECH